MSVLGSIMEIYNKSKIEIVNAVSGGSSLSAECGYLDDAEIGIKIEKVKKDINNINRRIAEVGNDKRVVDQLKEEYEDKLLEMVYLASNKLDQIDKLINLIPKKYNFYSCIDGLEKYKVGDYKSAYYALDSYIGNKEGFESHFLLNKIFGHLLILNEEFSRASIFLRKAITYRPDELDCHKMLLICYSNLNNTRGQNIEQSIIKMLEWGEEMVLVTKKKEKKSESKSLPLVSVNAYYRNGSIIKPYVRTHPDSYKFNNLSYKGGKNGCWVRKIFSQGFQNH